MINLMYVVLMAMLAMNVSTEVLEGFSLVEESLSRTTSNSTKENLSIYGDFEEQMKKNPAKVKEWFDKATSVKQMSDSLFNFAQELKEAIVREALANGVLQPPPPRKEVSPRIQELERQFRSWLGMKIKLTSNDKGKGKLVIQFNSNDDFERIYQALKPRA